METEKQQSLLPGYILQGKRNRYVIDRVLGQGAFGITYLARYKASIQGDMGAGSVWAQVAIKEFFMRDLNVRDDSTGKLNDVSQDSLIGRYRRAFMREARNLAELHHENIINVFELIETNNTVYIVMEYINGGSLDEYISNRGRLSEQESLSYMEQICAAVRCMHDSRMLHLDIKPKNVMLEMLDLDENGKLYLIDFGLSKQYSDNGEPESSTTVGLGTPGYAPIEQAEQRDGEKSFRVTLDTYALGATLYKMLTGNTPPKASQVSDSVINDDNIIPKQLKAAGISNGLTEVVTKAMWPSSRGRYQSVKELEDALKEVQTNNHKPTADGGGEQTIVVPENPVPHKEPEHTHNPEQEQKHKPEPEEKPVPPPPPTPKGNGFPKWPYAVIAVLVGVIVFLLIPRGGKRVQTSQPSSGTENGHEWVDLGLSVKWATCNVGASSPSAYGDYYAWGETSTKSSYTWENYRFRTSGNSWDNVKLSKYNTQSDRGIVDNRSTLELSDDVARQKWGGSWRMPTYEEFDELSDKCTWEWTTLNGVGGYRVTSEIPGYTNRSIFLPAAGSRDETSLDDAGSGFYWSGSLDTDDPIRAGNLVFGSDDHYYTSSGHRRHGQSVRPVLP